MTVLTAHSQTAKRLLAALGVPADAVTTSIVFEQGEPVIVTCEFYPDEPAIDEDGELETVLKEYVLTEKEEDPHDGI